MVKFYMNANQMRRLYARLIATKLSDSAIGSSLWLNGFGVTFIDKNGNTRHFDFLQYKSIENEYFYVKGDYPDAVKMILNIVHELGSSGEEDWCVSFDEDKN